MLAKQSQWLRAVAVAGLLSGQLAAASVSEKAC